LQQFVLARAPLTEKPIEYMASNTLTNHRACCCSVSDISFAETLSAISGVVPSAAGVLFTVEKVADEPKQVLVTRGTCTAKYTLADALLAKIEAAPKNSATGKAASFLAAVLALLALLVL
jgi:hypothetical protein